MTKKSLNMLVKTTLNYSPNFSEKKRRKNQVKFLIFHYTGMKNENLAINKLTKIQSQVSCHYFIKKSGEIITMVPDLYIAWHAGLSSWKNFKLLNQNSIGIEISNPGHYFGYEVFSKKQINSLLNLSKFLIKKYKINKKNILGHSDIAPKRKKDPGEKFPWQYLAKKNVGFWHNLKKKDLKDYRNKKIDKKNQLRALTNIFCIGYLNTQKKKEICNLVVKAFQRRFRPELINGKIDKECLLISQNLIN